MLVDTWEPRQIEVLLQHVFPSCARTNLNHQGFADYLYYDCNNEPEMVERKQVNEILSDMEGVEYQLRKELDKVRRTILLVEGTVLPTSKGCQVYVPSQNGKFLRPGHSYSFSYTRYESWLWGLEQVGVTVWRTASWEATADAIAMRAKSVLRPDHTTLARHLKPLPTFNADPHVQTLMGVKGGGIGPDKAEALVKVFRTAYAVLQADPEAIAKLVPGVGIRGAKVLLGAAGREL